MSNQALAHIDLHKKNHEVLIAHDLECPYICSSQQAPGFLIEVLLPLFKKIKISPQFIFFPTHQLNKTIQQNETDLLLTKNSLIQKFSSAISLRPALAITSGGIISKKKNLPLFYQFKELQSYQYILGSAVAIPFSNISKDHLLFGQNIHQRLVKLIDLERKSLAIGDYATLKYQLAKLKKEKTIHLYSAPLIPFDRFNLAIKVSNPAYKNIKKEYARYMKKLKSSEKLKRILSHYHLSDWSPYLGQ